jgi:Zn-finger protein
MENSHRFFNNNRCKYFPCHKISDNSNNSVNPDNNDFNCLFCYCPLYFLGDKCGGNFKYSGVACIKNCVDCLLPHTPEYYDVIVSKLIEAKNRE